MDRAAAKAGLYGLFIGVLATFAFDGLRLAAIQISVCILELVALMLILRSLRVKPNG